MKINYLENDKLKLKREGNVICGYYNSVYIEFRIYSRLLMIGSEKRSLKNSALREVIELIKEILNEKIQNFTIFNSNHNKILFKMGELVELKCMFENNIIKNITKEEYFSLKERWFWQATIKLDDVEFIYTRDSIITDNYEKVISEFDKIFRYRKK